MNSRHSMSSWALVLACTVAAMVGAARGIAQADSPSVPVAPVQSASSHPPSPPRAAHGLAPLPNGVRVPQHVRPPGSQPGDGGPTPVLLPAQRITVRFNHALHVGKLGVACSQCHTTAERSRVSSDRLIPDPKRCDSCHQSDHRDLTAVASDASKIVSHCGFCHVGYQPADGNTVRRLQLPKPRLLFNHAAHAKRQIGCRQCHGLVDKLELATRDQLPRMLGCYRCHRLPQPARGEASSECTTCHVAARGKRVRTRFPTGSLRPPRWLHGSGHDADWSERHRAVAGADSRLCANCHNTQECTDCHDGRVRPRRVHSNDWLSMHPIAARQLNPRCTSCHRHQSFCVGCHQRAGVARSGPYANFSNRGRFHPPKSVWTDAPRSARHHAGDAKRNLSACVSCHVERDCAVCHATAARGGPGGFGQEASPHPSGFRLRCTAAAKKNDRPCLVCHTPSDPNLRSCR